MGIRWIATLLCALASSVAVGVSAGAEPEANTMGRPPELGVAVVVHGRFIEVRRFVERMVTRTTTSNLPPGVKIEVKAGSIGPASSTEVVAVVETHVTRIDGTAVVAQRIDGRAVSSKVLMDELARPTPVVLGKQGQQVDPLFLKMFRPESLVLRLPSSTTPPPTMVPNYTAPANPRR
jgi:hypothetical protein